VLLMLDYPHQDEARSGEHQQKKSKREMNGDWMNGTTANGNTITLVTIEINSLRTY